MLPTVLQMLSEVTRVRGVVMLRSQLSNMARIQHTQSKSRANADLSISEHAKFNKQILVTAAPRDARRWLVAHRGFAQCRQKDVT